MTMRIGSRAKKLKTNRTGEIVKPILDKGVVDWIADLGVELKYTRSLPPQRLGAYLDDQKLILIRSGLTHVLEQETLHHEYAHAYYRDRSCHPRTEKRAWGFAARLIVDPVEYVKAERVSADPAFIAHELGTTARIIRAFQGSLARVGHVTYLAPRMGIGQWAHRLELA